PTRAVEYEIVAGERRWRAAQRAKLHAVPIVVREFSDTEVLEVAIVENIQRADLNPIEEAAGFQQLMDRFSRTQEQMATALGKSRPYIANSLRLLNLPDDVRGLVTDGRLSAGHARALVGHDKASQLAAEVVRRGLSVRETEKLAKAPDAKPKPAAARTEKDADTKALEGDLSATLGMRVSLDHAHGQDGGTLTIRYRDLDQLDDLCRLLGGG
ncbi:MAG: ParB/RepB/Spo0J family partition protein, partial [Pseudomonadota bacterium]